MILLAVVWFILLASSPGHCWSDARFSKVRQLGAKQYQESYKALVYAEDVTNPDVLYPSTPRPLFSWDLIPPSTPSLKAPTANKDRNPARNSTFSTSKVSSAKPRRKKNRNRRKHSNRKKIGNLSNETDVTSSQDKKPNKDIHRHLHETQKNHIFSTEERNNADKMWESFRVTKERKRKNKHRKERKGKRKPISDRRKGEKIKKKGDGKIKRRDRKQEDNNLISNSLPALANADFHKHRSRKGYDSVSFTQRDGKISTENQVTSIDMLSKSDNHFMTETDESDLRKANHRVYNNSAVKKLETQDSSEISGLKDNALQPLMTPSNMNKKDQAHWKSLNSTYEKINFRDNSPINKEVLKDTYEDRVNTNATIDSEFSNISLSNNLDMNILHKATYQPKEVSVKSREDSSARDKFSMLFHKDSSLSSINKTRSTNSLDEKPFPVGDLSCLTGTFLPAPSMPGAAIKYVRTQTTLPLQVIVYLVAEYKCHSQYHLKDPSIYQLTCSQRQWMGIQPSCVPNEGMQIHREECGENQKQCDHICEIMSDVIVCSCYRGFRLDGNTCKDIDECEVTNGGCESQCRNTLGSYHCVCPLGLRLADDGKSCLDVNECLLRNGHGPCQDSCHNLWASYECSCEGIPGTRLSADNHTCEDVDECADGTAGCSHTCLNTLGSAFCLCPAGFMLGDDWKTCQDINECSYEDLQTEHCELGCVNTIGSYHCLEKEEDTTGVQHTATELSVSCPEGMRLYHDRNCVDIDECEEKISGCTQSCINTNGSFQCICGLGFSLSSDNKTCIDGAAEAVCPPLDYPVHGYLECTRHLVRMGKSRYPWLKRTRVVNHAGSVCQLKCPHGFMLAGEYRKTCGLDKKWTGPENGTCILLPAPSIRCPNNMTVTMKPGNPVAYVTIQQPVTNVNWFRYVEATPHWGKSLEANLSAGHWEVKFTARHPTSHLTASCVLTISVISDN